MIKLSELRNEKGLTQREIAKIFNVSQGTYNNWENGKTQPSIEQLVAIADFFGVSIDYLVGREGEDGVIASAKDDRINLSDKSRDALYEFLKTISDKKKLTALRRFVFIMKDCSKQFVIICWQRKKKVRYYNQK